MSAEGDRPPGSVIGGRYRIVGMLADGGMGSVYQAQDGAGRVVAVKVLHSFLTDDEIAVARFAREARTAASAASRHVVEVLDHGRDGGAPFIVMEHVPGQTLARALQEESPFSAERAVGIAWQILDALSAVHRSGVIHRDLKPDNVVLTDRGGTADFVKLLDFGIATFVEASRTDELTPIGRSMGTPFYASPEQLNGDRPSVAMDIWAVGTLLYQMLAGEHPFRADDQVESYRLIREAEPTPLAAFSPALPAGLEAIVRRALAKLPAERWDDARAMADALAPYEERGPA